MEITREKIETVYRLVDELTVQKEVASEAIKEAQRHWGNPVLIKRKDGTEQEVTEKMLWDEVWSLGSDCDAGHFLKSKYPLPFQHSDVANAKARELSTYTLAELGIDAQAVRVSDILRLTEAMVEYKLNERELERRAGAKA